MAKKHPGLQVHGKGFRFVVFVDGQRTYVKIPDRYCGTSQEAYAYMQRYKSTAGPRVLSKVTFGEYASQWLEVARLRPSTRRNYENDLKNHLVSLHHKKVRDLDVPDIRFLIEEMERKENPRGGSYSGNTIRNVLVPVSRILNKAVADGILDTNPIEKLERGARPKCTGRAEKRILTPDEVRTLLDAAYGYARAKAPGSSEHYSFHKAFVGLALFAGLRRGEILRLKWSDIDFDLKLISIANVDLVKTENAIRRVELPYWLATVLQTHRKEVMFRSDLVFSTRTGQPWAERNASRAFTEIVEKAGLAGEPHLTLHQLRHNYATALISQGADVSYVSQMLGHRSPKITLEIYTHEFRSVHHRGEAAAAIDAVYGLGQ